MPAWPDDLPQVPLDDRYSEQDDANLIESPTETGPGKTRPRQSHAAMTIPATLALTGEQKRSLRSFHRNTLAFGAIPFDWPAMDAQIDDGEAHRYRMAQAPKFVPDGEEWRAEIQIKVW